MNDTRPQVAAFHRWRNAPPQERAAIARQQAVRRDIFPGVAEVMHHLSDWHVDDVCDYITSAFRELPPNVIAPTGKRAADCTPEDFSAIAEWARAILVAWCAINREIERSLRVRTRI